ncbi:uncharacterized protein N7473_012789 [Penicillium subrubescens]|uniref:Uncharacterized protein n=1 Tax=Penicillium subrubescens TaxID=1316194 RepID=A0A1Q5UGL1_9EURO|nr:uncharacterized protein N7473_012789 [Penicillium subrubescens]KAJ5875442.1 hypothetical protein N7473_012789 [Penicillium subrubescens]OKP11606.1 hypothetical protein PENSUB_2908 [Penicillium subrubescens]
MTTSKLIPQFQHLISQLRGLDIAYLSLGNPRWETDASSEGKDPVEDSSVFIKSWGSSRPIPLSGGYTASSAQRAVDVDYPGYQIAPTFGRFFISTPDLPFRIKAGLSLQQYHHDTFYTPGSKRGYVDYPFSEEFLAQCEIQATVI